MYTIRNHQVLAIAMASPAVPTEPCFGQQLETAHKYEYSVMDVHFPTFSIVVRMSDKPVNSRLPSPRRFRTPTSKRWLAR